jgi:hypothetical protein
MINEFGIEGKDTTTDRQTQSQKNKQTHNATESESIYFSSLALVSFCVFFLVLFLILVSLSFLR